MNGDSFLLKTYKKIDDPHKADLEMDIFNLDLGQLQTAITELMGEDGTYFTVHEVGNLCLTTPGVEKFYE
jgi:hypothetical protein